MGALGSLRVEEEAAERFLRVVLLDQESICRGGTLTRVFSGL